EVTAQMVLNFARGGAGINVLARRAGARVVVVDMGVKGELPRLPEVRSVRVGPGTRNAAAGPAMTVEETVRALEAGIAIAGELVDEGIGLLAIGEMGIANSTSASALAAAFTGRSPAEVTGRGTGIDDARHAHKVEVVARMLRVNALDPWDPLRTLAALGGYEIAGMAGVVLGAAARRVPVLTDGFIATAGAVAAAQLAPRARHAVLASHQSVEAGHRHLLALLGARPLLDLGLRLGEGTGAALTMGLVDAAVSILREMATFESAGVSGASA
ncbi:MAG TPA: nicotinate-nucleotide--dimethylbenzimidazole phosphoribosyltransferase, partial [Anaeromyxobacteraceae bacterium]|nr:nicotinate-nucleotide--dimethylbenzimidazole phosphoribosyltransferase [Anaeromyxobacteraceae bacterium]